jgi:NAD dependent epimerase/dehydratase family enzyme
MPWIHINDLCGIYLKAIEDIQIKGAYNAVAPQQITHSDFMKTLARVMKIRKVVIPIPAFIIRTVLGEMSDVILKGSRVSSEKILNSGYTFHYVTLEKALCNIIRG